MGFTMIGLEILLLLAFQAIYGYFYQQLAILIGAFMAGMAAGKLAGPPRAAGAARWRRRRSCSSAPLLLTGLC